MRMAAVAWIGLALASTGLSARAEEASPGAAPGGSQEAETPAPAGTSRWGPLDLLVGTWEGEIQGKLGTGRGVRRYQRILGGRFLLSNHRSVRLPQEQSPEGDEHEELAVFSYDSERGAIAYREFMIEGVVIRSTCSIDGMAVVCDAEHVESGPGIRARLTLEIEDRYRFVERYELAFPGHELELYFTNLWTRSPVPIDWD